MGKVVSVTGRIGVAGAALAGDGGVAEAILRLAEAIAGGKQWMTAREAAEFLRYDQSTFNRIAAAGEIPRHKRGAGYRYYAPELTEWLLSG